VELLGSRGNVVGTGVIDGNIKCGTELNAMKLCPSEVAVRVVEVSDGSVWTGEIVGEWSMCRPMCRPCHTLEESIATNYRGETPPPPLP
jgi:hypothetical protein